MHYLLQVLQRVWTRAESRVLNPAHYAKAENWHIKGGHRGWKLCIYKQLKCQPKKNCSVRNVH